MKLRAVVPTSAGTYARRTTMVCVKNQSTHQLADTSLLFTRFRRRVCVRVRVRVFIDFTNQIHSSHCVR